MLYTAYLLTYLLSVCVCVCVCVRVVQECPSGVVNEDTFKYIYAQFFPQGGQSPLYSVHIHTYQRTFAPPSLHSTKHAAEKNGIRSVASPGSEGRAVSYTHLTLPTIYSV